MNNHTHKCKIVAFQSRNRGIWYYETVSDIDREVNGQVLFSDGLNVEDKVEE